MEGLTLLCGGEAAWRGQWAGRGEAGEGGDLVVLELAGEWNPSPAWCMWSRVCAARPSAATQACVPRPAAPLPTEVVLLPCLLTSVLAAAPVLSAATDLGTAVNCAFIKKPEHICSFLHMSELPSELSESSNVCDESYVAVTHSQGPAWTAVLEPLARHPAQLARSTRGWAHAG